MKRFVSLLMIAAILVMALSGCGETEEPYSPDGPLTLSNPSGETWTVMLYLCGTDLNRAAGTPPTICRR